MVSRLVSSLLSAWVVSVMILSSCEAGDSVQTDANGTQTSLLIRSIQFKEPLLFLGERVPLDRRDIRERLEKEMLLSLWDRPQVILWLKRASRYLPHVEKFLKEYGMPQDLKYVPVVESALRPHSGSAKGAIGFWQFLRATGRKYGLRIDAAMDERRNIFKSTEAACKYLKDLHEQFNSWPLALAAYNMGENGLASEIKLQETNDYYSLYLSLETQRYFFKLITAKLILENPESYDFYLKPEDLYPVFSFDTVTIDAPDQIPLTVISRSAGVTFKEIKDMNPEIRGYYLDKGKNTILVPKGTARSFETQFKTLLAIWRKENSKHLHVVKKGEYLSGIAEKYKIPLPALLKMNNLSYNSYIHPGDRLIVYSDRNYDPSSVRICSA